MGCCGRKRKMDGNGKGGGTMIALLKRLLNTSGKYKKRIYIAFVFSFLKAMLMKAPVGFAFVAIAAFIRKEMTGKLCLEIGIAMFICVALQLHFSCFRKERSIRCLSSVCCCLSLICLAR